MRCKGDTRAYVEMGVGWRGCGGDVGAVGNVVCVSGEVVEIVFL